MKRFLMNTAAVAATLGMLSVPAFAAGEPTVREVNVTAQVTNLDDSAKEYYPNIAHDILEKITEEMPLTTDNKGYVVNVEIQNMTLNGDKVLPASKEFNQLEGVMSIVGEGTNAGAQSYPIRVVAQSADVAAPEGFIAVTPSDNDFYTALITGFAKAVAEHEPEVLPSSVSK